MTKKAPEIHVAFSLNGKVRNVDVVSDTREDREAGLKQLQRILPAIELIESLLAPEPPNSSEAISGQAAGIKS